MKNFFYVVAGEDLNIFRSVGGQQSSNGINLKGDYIHYLEEEKVWETPVGSASFVAVFGSDAFNTLSDPITVDSVLADVASGTTDSTWYVVSASSSSVPAEHKGELMWFGTLGSIVAQRYMKPFDGLSITIGTSSYEWSRIPTTDHRWRAK
jgi:hypothetical protein